MPTIELTLEIKYSSKWRSGSGEGGLVADRLIRRDARGWPYLPGSTIKGVIREDCEKLWRLLAPIHCHPIDPHDRDLSRQRAFGRLGGAHWPVEILFGTNFEEGGLFFRDATLSAAPYRGQDYQTRIRRYRQLGTIKEAHLFATEYAQAQIFTTTVTGYHQPEALEAFEEGDLPYAYCLLVAGILSVNRLGGDKSTGSGEASIDITSFLYKAQPQKIDKIFDYLDREYIAESFSVPLKPKGGGGGMKHFRLTARLLAPLAIQQDRQSNTSASLDYLPGSSLRGALAAHWRRLGGRVEDMGFRSLFLDNPVKFPNLLPTDDPTVIPQILPLTTLACKIEPGFRTQGAHGVEDGLTLIAAGRLLPNCNLTSAWDCLTCGQERKPYSAVWNGEVDNALKYDVTMTYQRHTGIDRLTGTVAETIFYTTQTVADFRKDKDRDEYHPQHLSGGMWLDDQQEGYLRSICDNGSIFVGADRTRGLGELTLELTEAAGPVFDRQTWDAWDQGFKSKYHRLTGQDLPDGHYFSLKLASSAILVDEFLRPTALLPLNFQGLESHPVVEVAKTQIVRGWQSSWGLPKPDDLALKIGSVYLWRYLGDSPDVLVAQLQRLTQEGISLRREEGFGRLAVCEPLQVREVI